MAISPSSIYSFIKKVAFVVIALVLLGTIFTQPKTTSASSTYGNIHGSVSTVPKVDQVETTFVVHLHMELLQLPVLLTPLLVDMLGVMASDGSVSIA